MSEVRVELLDDDYVPDEGEDVGPDLAREPTEVGVRYLMSLGTSEFDARHLVAIAKGEVGPDARAIDASMGGLSR